MSTPTLVTMFSGGGLADAGFKAAGFQPIGAVEFDPEIASVYVHNHGDHVIIASVCDVDYRKWAGADLLHASPSCKNASVANSDSGETAEDIACADAVCRALREIRPRWFSLENVVGYARFLHCFPVILNTLRELGYQVHYATYNMANYAVPQTRKRLILRACRDTRVPALPQTHCEGGESGGLFGAEHGLKPWVGWYAAIADLIPTLPESRFADWQIKRFPEWLTGQAALVDCVHRTDAPLTARAANEPAHTIKASDMRRPGNIPRAFLVDGQQTTPGANGERGISVPHGDAPALTVTASSMKGLPRAFLVESKNSNQQYGDGLRYPHEPATTVVTDGKPSHLPKALLIGDQQGARVPGQAQRPPQLALADEPSFTLRAGENGGANPRAWLEQGRVVSMSPRALARFQGTPDTYILPCDLDPKKRSLSCTVIGNGVPPLFCQQIGAAFLRTL